MDDSDDNNNIPDSSPKIHRTLASTIYGILAPMGVVLLVTAVMLLSYFFTNRIRISGAAIPPRDDDDELVVTELGLNEATILRFPMLIYSQVTKNNTSPSASCSICLSNYDESDTVRILPECNHFFHLKCVDPWLKLNSTCPICRKPLGGIHSVTAA